VLHAFSIASSDFPVLALPKYRFCQPAFASCGPFQLLRDLIPTRLVAAAEAGEHDF
jgi:hypothetical protein